MWFYSLVGNNQAEDPWLDEALASYAEARFEDTFDEFGAQSVPAAGQGRAGEPLTYWADHGQAYYRSVYVQGALAVLSLGDADLVDCALRHYVAAQAYSIADPADFFDAVAVVFPDAAETMAPYGLAP